MNFKFTSAHNWNWLESDKHAHSDQIVTIPDESLTVRELLLRSQHNTLPPLSQHSDYDDDTLDLDDELAFYEVKDLHDVYKMKDIIEDHIYRLEHAKKKSAELEHQKINLAQEKEETEPE